MFDRLNGELTTEFVSTDKPMNEMLGQALFYSCRKDEKVLWLLGLKPLSYDLYVPLILGILPPSTVFGPSIPWMLGLYTGRSQFCLQLEWALWLIALEDEYLGSSEQIWKSSVSSESIVWRSEGPTDDWSQWYGLSVDCRSSLKVDADKID